MTEIVLARRLSHKQAQRERSRWIRTQKAWDHILHIKTGLEVYPPPHQVFRVQRDGRRFCVVFDDPTL
jgi:hypothetical protein